MRGTWVRAAIVPVLVAFAWFLPAQLSADAEPIVTSVLSNVTVPSPGTSTAPVATTTTTVSTTAVSTTTLLSTTSTDPGVVDRSTISTSAPPSTETAPTVASTTTLPGSVPLASTTTTVVDRGAIGDRALSRVGFDWRSAFPGWQIDFLGPRDGLRALTYPRERRVEIFVRSSDTESSLHRVIAHELGHVLDVEFNSTADRDRWVAQRGIDDSVPWWPSASAPDFATGAGDFAEAFAVWETGITTRSSVAGQPSSADLQLLAELARG